MGAEQLDGTISARRDVLRPDQLAGAEQTAE